MKNLKLIFLSVLIMFSFLSPAWAQVVYELNPKTQEKLNPLAFLEGRWKGSGWMMGEDRSRSTFDQEEIVEFKLSETVLEIEGIGRSDGQVVHHALALIQPAEEEGKFSFTSFLQSGVKGTYPAYMEEGKLIWQPNEQVRYVVQINDQGQWYEIGEYNAGSSWYQFFEMTLDKVQ